MQIWLNLKNNLNLTWTLKLVLLDLLLLPKEYCTNDLNLTRYKNNKSLQHILEFFIWCWNLLYSIHARQLLCTTFWKGRKWEWLPEHDASLYVFKHNTSRNVILPYPDLSKFFEIVVHSSTTGAAAILLKGEIEEI